jgi:hypothetical protein
VDTLTVCGAESRGGANENPRPSRAWTGHPQEGAPHLFPAASSSLRNTNPLDLSTKRRTIIEWAIGEPSDRAVPNWG